MRKAALFLCVLYVSALFVVSANAGGGVTGGATEITQLLNNTGLLRQTTELTRQLQQQIQMVQDMLANTIGLPNKLFGEVMGMVSQVMNSYNQIQGILHQLSNIDEEFYKRFFNQQSSETWVENYSDAYFELSETLEKQAKKTVESLGISADDITDSGSLLTQLANNANTASGRNQIMQAGNELLGFIGGELVKARALSVEQTKLYLDYAERERAIQDAAAEVLRDDLSKWVPPGQVNVQFDW